MKLINCTGCDRSYWNLYFQLYSWHLHTDLFSFPCFIMRGWLVGLVLSPARFVSQFYLLIKCGAITDPFLTAIRHRIVWMRPQLLHILLSQTKPHLQFLGGIPKEKSNFNFLSVTYNSPISLLSSMSFTRVLQCCQHRVMF